MHRQRSDARTPARGLKTLLSVAAVLVSSWASTARAEVQSCYTGPAGTAGVGPCRSGTQTCTDGVCGPCLGQMLPAVEVCNGIDDDCDGAPDDGVTQACSNSGAGSSVGACRLGTKTCVGGAFGPCLGEIGPTVETCNNADDNCNGTTDEGLTTACYSGPAGTSGVGVCHGGTSTCAAGVFGACVGEVVPSTEVCNNIDDDCDGATDEGVTQGCYSGPAGTSGVGACHGGTQTCAAGVFGACAGEVVPGAETCNGVDDDCDGTPDDGTDLALCGDATKVCDHAAATPACRTGCRDDAACGGATPACDLTKLTCQQCTSANATSCAAASDGTECILGTENHCGCSDDGACGTTTSGRICGSTTKKCEPGCAVGELDGGVRNGCPSGTFCTTTTPGTVGACTTSCNFDADCAHTDATVADTALADTAVADTSVADTSVADTSVADTSGTLPSVDGGVAATDGGDPVSVGEDDSGCGCTLVGANDVDARWAWLTVGALGLAVARRRRHPSSA